MSEHRARGADRKGGCLMALLAGTLVLVISGGAIYVNRMVAASEQRDCLTLAADIGALSVTPPTTPSGKRVLEARRDRYREIGCEPDLPAAK